MTLGVGERFAGYTIVRQLGSGGMGEVYLAQHPRLPRQDALKVLRPQISDDDTFRQRFIQEADMAAALTHPHIVTVYDRGDTDGTLWIATQFIDGTDAAALIRDRYPSGIPLDEACEILTAIAGALDYAHDRGLLHRDVKPANILLSNPDRAGRRQIYLADFGIARPLTDGPGLTATNTTLGTFAYSAPEQLMGESLDGRADQYALAATAYDLLSGTPPFTATSNPIAVISKHLNAIPAALSTHRPELAALDGVFARGLAKEPAQRYRTCAEFAAAITDSAQRITPTSPYAQTQAAATVSPPSAPTLQAPPEPPRPVTPPAPAPAAQSVSRNRARVNAFIAVAVVLGGLALLSTQVSNKDSNPSSSSRPTSSPSSTADYASSPPTTPAFVIAPLQVRPVVSAFVTTPDQCPAPAPTPPDQTVRICDFTKTAVYELKPEALRVQLNRVESFRNPVTGEQTVQMSMTNESADQFRQFTAGQVGNQIAFVRAGMVVWGPKITAPIDGQVLQLSGDLTPAQGQEIARLLRDEN